VLYEALLQSALSRGLACMMIEVAQAAGLVEERLSLEDSIPFSIPGTDTGEWMGFEMTPIALVHILRTAEFKLPDEAHLLVLRILLIGVLKSRTPLQDKFHSDLRKKRELVHKLLLELSKAFLQSVSTQQSPNGELLAVPLDLASELALLHILLQPVDVDNLPDDPCHFYSQYHGPLVLRYWLLQVGLFDAAVLEHIPSPPAIAPK